ncbi:hypothetical protein MESS2_70006 [Mesorhizobium metallidurans STM 2683]|uniref:Uncharacterized protein n=1 Tax=Mesorhizobium metallidurans STM 2683 TaxID=1297569 RepID=M5ESW3_9HYPH|nr:hypothetical protein MESS2_70006 [Mesorhizobium metallidurans STM 2683]
MVEDGVGDPPLAHSLLQFCPVYCLISGCAEIEVRNPRIGHCRFIREATTNCRMVALR